jgi:GNAT superfamily N-acetyltransferase
MPTIRKATDSDLPVLARTYGRAFADDPVIRWLIPDKEEYAAIHGSFFTALALRGRYHDTLWCTDDGVAVAYWNPPGRPEAVVVDPDPIDHPAWRIERFIALTTAMQANTPSELHWHLNLIGTHPDWQGRGLAAALMAEVFAVADAAGLPCYLETASPANVAYYLRHGFVVRSEWDVTVPGHPGPHMWGMLRDPR